MYLSMFIFHYVIWFLKFFEQLQPTTTNSAQKKRAKLMALLIIVEKW